MNKHAVLSVILIIAFMALPFMVHAAIFVTPKQSFGGKVLSTTNPIVTCNGPGTGPVVLSSNLLSLGSAVYSGVKGNSAVTKASGIINGLYNAIPYYAQLSYMSSGTTTFVTPTPKVGDWILGLASISPEFSNCYIPAADDFPFPVKDTSNYNVSR